MSRILTEYERRLQERELLSSGNLDGRRWSEIQNLKFTPNGEIKPFFGLTCITWVDPRGQLYENLCSAQRKIQASFERIEVSHFFSFLEPASFHMTICDITANPQPNKEQEARAICSQIQDAFSQGLSTQAIDAKVRGIGFKTTIGALVRFVDTAQLQKVLHLENVIKDATQVDLRAFTGHITLAYCVKPPENRLDEIWSILKPFQGYFFGDFTISTFDLTCFTDMNTFIPLATFNLETGQISNHSNLDHCMLC